jgi:hypothetical protein
MSTKQHVFVMCLLQQHVCLFAPLTAVCCAPMHVINQHRHSLLSKSVHLSLSACLSACLFLLQDPQLLCHPLVSPTYLTNFTGLCQAGMLVVAGGAELMRPDIQAFAAKAAKAAVATTPAAAAAAPAAPKASSPPALRVSEAPDEVDGGCSSSAAAAAAGADAGGTRSTAAAATGGGAGSSSRSSFSVVYHEEPNELHVFPMLTLPQLLKKGLVVPRFVAAAVTGEPLDGKGPGNDLEMS